MSISGKCQKGRERAWKMPKILQGTHLFIAFFVGNYEDIVVFRAFQVRQWTYLPIQTCKAESALKDIHDSIKTTFRQTRSVILNKYYTLSQIRGFIVFYFIHELHL